MAISLSEVCAFAALQLLAARVRYVLLLLRKGVDDGSREHTLNAAREFLEEVIAEKEDIDHLRATERIGRPVSWYRLARRALARSKSEDDFDQAISALVETVKQLELSPTTDSPGIEPIKAFFKAVLNEARFGQDWVLQGNGSYYDLPIHVAA